MSTGPCNSCTFSAHGTLLSLGGNRANTDGRLLVDGISIAVPQAGGTNYLTDTRNAQEVTFTMSGSMGEVESGGPVMNIIPRSGGNTLSGNGFVVVGQRRPAGQQPERRAAARCASRPSPLIKSYDLSGAVGGPISRDRAVVLRHRARPGQLELHHEHVLQQERRRPERVALRAGPSRARRSTTRPGRTPAAASPRRSRRATR